MLVSYVGHVGYRPGEIGYGMPHIFHGLLCDISNSPKSEYFKSMNWLIIRYINTKVLYSSKIYSPTYVEWV